MTITQQIITQLKTHHYTGLYLLQGNEAAYYTQTITQHLHTSAPPHHLRTYHANQATLQDIIIEAQQQTITGEKKILIIKEAHKLPTLRKPSGKQLLINYLKTPSQNTLLLFAYNDKPLPAHSTLPKLLAQQKRLFTCKTPYTNQIPAWIQTYLKEKGYTITPQAITALQTLTNPTLHILTHELDKLLINLPQSHTLQEQDIHKHIQSTKTYTPFHLQQALSTKNITQTHNIIHHLTQNTKKHPIPYIIITLTTFYTKLLKLQHKPTTNPHHIAKTLQIQPYLTTTYLQATQHYTLKQTLQNITYLHHADLQLKGINHPALPPSSIIKELIAKLLTPHTPLNTKNHYKFFPQPIFF